MSKVFHAIQPAPAPQMAPASAAPLAIDFQFVIVWSALDQRTRVLEIGLVDGACGSDG